MKQINYDSVKIIEIEQFKKLTNGADIICDADSKTIRIEDNSLEEAFKKINNSIKLVTNAFEKFAKTITDAFKPIYKDLNHILNKKITKKRFMKLLQSKGIQRNAINEIVRNNKTEYTYGRYLQTINSFSKK